MFGSNSLYRRYFRKIRRSVRFLLSAGRSMFHADETPLPAQMRTDLGKHMLRRRIERGQS